MPGRVGDHQNATLAKKRHAPTVANKDQTPNQPAANHQIGLPPEQHTSVAVIHATQHYPAKELGREHLGENTRGETPRVAKHAAGNTRRKTRGVEITRGGGVEISRGECPLKKKRVPNLPVFLILTSKHGIWNYRAAPSVNRRTRERSIASDFPDFLVVFLSTNCDAYSALFQRPAVDTLVDPC